MSSLGNTTQNSASANVVDSSTAAASATQGSRKPVLKLPEVTVRLAGDSGDGMQLVGMQFTDTSGFAGNDVCTFPDYPAEIRAPAGSIAGVSGFQVHLASSDIYTPGDEVDALVAMNPAALKANIKALKRGGIVMVNEDAFTAGGLKKAGYDKNPLDDGSLAGYHVVRVPMDRLNAEAVKPSGLTASQADRCKNFFALGVIYWLYDRPLEQTLAYIQSKFGKKQPAAAMANALTLKAGYNFGETSELLAHQYQIDKAKLPPGEYRTLNGNEAAALGMVTAAKLANTELFYGSYPITPASDILHTLSACKNFPVVTFQAEDEICAIGAAIGAAFGGALAATGTSGPGLALKTEAMGLAVMTELPLVIVDVQRGGPSTGLPTKTEQADLWQAVFGRNGECPIPVIAAASPSDCFWATLEAFRVAVKYMTPVIVLTDGYLANGTEPFRIPDVSKLPPIEVKHPTQTNFVTPDGKAKFVPYLRDEKLVRPWAIPGTPGLEHRVGGLEKQDVTGAVSYDGANHDKMVRLRAKKVAGIKPEGEPWLWNGPTSGDVLLVGWGDTHGAIQGATQVLRQRGVSISSCQIRYLNPLPEGLEQLLKSFKHVIVPELNLGQLRLLLRATYLIDVKGFNRVHGAPMSIQEVVHAVEAELAQNQGK